jgi:hypothetical protein
VSESVHRLAKSLERSEQHREDVAETLRRSEEAIIPLLERIAVAVEKLAEPPAAEKRPADWFGSAWINGQPVSLDPDDADEALELAWWIIANAGGGEWSTQSPEWQEAATKWRDRVMPGLSERAARRANGGGS